MAGFFSYSLTHFLHAVVEAIDISNKIPMGSGNALYMDISDLLNPGSTPRPSGAALPPQPQPTAQPQPPAQPQPTAQPQVPVQQPVMQQPPTQQPRGVINPVQFYT